MRNRLLVVAGLIGGGVGAVGATWQWAVELAQVSAGVVQYPANAPALIVEHHLWSSLNQLLALALHFGVSEYVASLVLSALMTATVMQALALVVYALARDERFAIGCAAIVVFTNASSYGAVYPIDLLPTPHSYGAIGLSLCVLVAALLANEYTRTAAFLAGLSLSIHVATGVWAVVTLALAIAVSRRRPSRAAVNALALGLSASAVSLAIHWAMRPHVEALPASDVETFTRTFVTLWDVHRQPVRWTAAGLWFNVAAVVIAALSWTRSAGPTRLLLAFVAGSGVLAILCVLAGSLPYDRLPTAFVIAMPGRFLNVDALLLAPFIAALLVRLENPLAPTAAFVVVAALAFSDRSPLTRYLAQWLDGWPGIPQAAVLAVASLATALLVTVSSRQPSDTSTRAGSRRVSGWVTALAIMVSAAGVVALAQPAASAGPSDRLGLRSDDAVVFAAASQSRGTLLTASNLWLIQLRARRPVLLEGGTLDTLPYAIENGPFVAKVLEDVYGISFASPPEAGRHLGQLARSFGREHWESFAVEDWLRIADQYGVSEIVTYRDWHLALPERARGDTLVLYEIPR